MAIGYCFSRLSIPNHAPLGVWLAARYLSAPPITFSVFASTFTGSTRRAADAWEWRNVTAARAQLRMRVRCGKGWHMVYSPPLDLSERFLRYCSIIELYSAGYEAAVPWRRVPRSRSGRPMKRLVPVILL